MNLYLVTKYSIVYVCINFLLSSWKSRPFTLFRIFFFATNKNSIMDKLTKLWLGFSMVSYTPSLQEYGSALIYNIALKETKALLVPKNKYTEEDLPTVQLPYSSVPNQEWLRLVPTFSKERKIRELKLKKSTKFIYSFVYIYVVGTLQLYLT